MSADSSEVTEQIPDSDDGLVCAFLLDGQGGGQRLSWDELDADHQGVVWIHLDFEHPRGRDWLIKRGNMDSLVTEALLSVESRPRSQEFENGILTVLRGVNKNPGQDVDDMVSIRIWTEKNRIISTRRRRLMSIRDIRSSLEHGNGPTGPGSFLVNLSDRLGDRIVDAVESMDETLDKTEEFSADMPTFRAKLSELRRKTARIRRYLAPQRDALDRLSRSAGEVVSLKEAAMLQEQANRIMNFIEEMDLIRERALVAQEEALSIIAYEQNARMLVLSIVAAVFLPLAFFTGLMGMNVAGLPGLEYPNAFWIVLALMFAAAGVILGYFKRKKWL
ncbi:MAG TPA: zinc transporter ZntB [Xanthomonadales bacterium]|nr:zinc transporter ZntB [Xanthomonadales bacterium]